MVGAAGNLYVTDGNNNTIRRITPGGVVTTFAGLAGTVGSDDGNGNSARFSGPRGIAVDTSGRLYVADAFNNEIRAVSLTADVSTLAGSGGSGSTDGAGTAARFQGPQGLAVDASGNVYVSDTGNDTIRKITPAGVVTTLAGLAGVAGSTDGVGNSARFDLLAGLAVDASGIIYAADSRNFTIRKITPAGVVTTWAGLAGNQGSADGAGAAARFYYPSGIKVDSSGNAYVADGFNHTIRKIGPAGIVSTLAGLAGAIGSQDGMGSAARFNILAAFYWMLRSIFMWLMPLVMIGPARSFLARHRRQALFTTVISAGDIAVIFDSMADARAFLQPYRILRLTPEIAYVAAALDRELIDTAGNRLGENDNWIAGFCRYYFPAVGEPG